MTIRLFQVVPDGACAAARKILDFKGVEYEIIDVLKSAPERAPVSNAASSPSGNPPDVPNVPSSAVFALNLPVLEAQEQDPVVGLEQIISYIEKIRPEPTLFPKGYAGIHRLLARHLGGELEKLIIGATLPDILALLRTRGEANSAELYLRWVEQRWGRETAAQALKTPSIENRQKIEELLKAVDPELGERAFLLGRIGLADFAFYGALSYLAFLGEDRWPACCPNLLTYFMRLERITARPRAE